MAKYLDQHGLETLANKIKEIFVKDVQDSQYYVRTMQNWEKLPESDESEVVIKLATNQSDHSDINGVHVHVKYDDKNLDLVWEGKPLIIKMPGGTHFTIGFDDVENYKTPLQIQDIAPENSSITREAIYNTCILVVNILGLTSSEMVDASVEYDGITKTLASGTPIKIPWGKTVTVSSPLVEGYDPVSSQVFNTTNNQNKIINIQYGKPIVPENILSFDIYSNLGRIDTNAIIETARVNIYWKGGSALNKKNGDFVEDVPEGDVKFVFSDIEGHRKPVDKKHPEQPIGTVIVHHTPYNLGERFSFYYEAGLVTAHVSNGIGQTVTINEESYVLEKTPQRVERILPMDAKYTISFSRKPGSLPIRDKTGVVDKESIYYPVTYSEQPAGVFAVDNAGNMFESTSGNPEIKNAIGVYVGDDKGHSFVIALDDVDRDGTPWSENDTIISGLTENSKSEAMMDFDGKGNTEKIINALTPGHMGGNYAAHLCKKYTFPGSTITGQSYLGSAGEWNLIAQNISSIQSLLREIPNGNALEDGSTIEFPGVSKYYTSTLANNDLVWTMHAGHLGLETDVKDPRNLPTPDKRKYWLSVRALAEYRPDLVDA